MGNDGGGGNTLINGGFEGGWRTLPGGNQEPEGWTLAWAMPGDPLLAPKAGNGDTERKVIRTPECVHKLSIQLPEDEQLGGEDALIRDGDRVYKVFGEAAFRTTLAQQFMVTPGAECRLTVPVQVHGKLKEDGTPYNVDVGAAYWRLTINGQAGKWFTFGNDFQDRTWMVYSPAFTALYGVVDIVLEFESHTVAAVDFFIDGVRFESESTQPAACRGAPRMQYARHVYLLPQDATLEDMNAACALAYPTRGTVLFSADDGGIGDLDSRRVTVLYPNTGSWDKTALDTFYVENYPGTVVNHAALYNDAPAEPPPVEPPAGFVPVNYTPFGCKVWWHGVGDDGQTSIQQHVMALGGSMATAKGCVDLGWMTIIKTADPKTRTVGRVIDLKGINMEWFDANQDPIGQAQNRMNALATTMGANPAVDYWEIINEQDFANEIGHWQLCLFYIEAMRIAETWGKKLAIFSYSTGVPEPWEWDFMAGSTVFEWCAAGGHAIALHEYGLWPRDQVSLLTRYRYVYEMHIVGQGLNIPLFITEYGPDAWTFEHLSDDEMMAQLIAYDQQLALDPYVVGAHVFTVGGAVGGWQPMRDRWVRLYGRYIDYVNSVKGRRNGG